jgi:nucleotide-binding universal stress UspA family protein
MNIFLAIDTSASSAAAVAAVVSQFAPTGNAVHVFHAADWPTHLPPAYAFAEGRTGARDVMALHDRILAEGQACVDQAAKTLRAAGFTVTTEVVADGETRRMILETAAKWPADVIVVGSHGRTGLDRLLLGSVSEAVVRRAPCSVEVVRVLPKTASA